ncbi:MAG: lamin tail domain-containing protein, partial [Verrucomicrobia bacterium]|nr:lamin tail domain-containing protein [Verrucomicrobiota bacterium]
MKHVRLPQLGCLAIFSLLLLPRAAPSQVLISEFMAGNVQTLTNRDGQAYDWIELHNAGVAGVDLAGYALTDDLRQLDKWLFPSVLLPPGGYLLVWASGLDRRDPAGELHANFRLDNAGEFLALVQPDGVTFGSLFNPAYPPQDDDEAYGIGQKALSTALLAAAVPEILVPAQAGAVAADWAMPQFVAADPWFSATAPAAIGFDVGEPGATPVNVAPGGTAVQTTTYGTYAANLAIDGNLANFTQTLPTDNPPFWQVTLARETSVHRIVLRNRTSCCQSRLRDITVQILAADGITTNYASPLLNPENIGFTYPAGPASLEVDLNALAGGPIFGHIVRVLRAPDPDLSGSGGQGGSEEAGTLSLGEVEVHGVPTATEVNLARTGTPPPTATQSSDYGTGQYPASFAIDGDTGNFTHTLNTDLNATWVLNLGRRALIHSITIHNRDSCCGSRLRDLTVRILDADSNTVLYTSAMLNPENAGYAFPNGPDHLVLNLSSQPVLGQYVRINRTPDPDLSGTGGQGNEDEANVLSMGEVIVLGLDISSYRPFIRTDLQTRMLGQNASAFVRLPFQVDDPGAFDELALRVRYDDGFIAYLNGVKVAERNAPPAPAWDSAATADRDLAAGLQAEEINLTAELSWLVAGTNVLAFQALNSSAGDGNFLLQPELTSLQIDTSSYAYLRDPTPGRRNESDHYLEEVADTRFSVNRGFFDAPFTLEITSATPDAQIWYSFDSSEPGPGLGGQLYTGPLTISNTTVVRARAFKAGCLETDVDTQTYLFLADVIHQSPDGTAPPYFPASWGRNRVNYGMDPAVIAKYSLAEWRDALTQIPTLSVVTEMKNLFDPATGIYANADGHGETWERPSSIELLDPTNAVPGRFQENCGLRIRGGYSRNATFVKHSFRVFFRRDYGAPKLQYKMFEDEGASEFDTFDLRTSQNYAWPRETSTSSGQNDTMVREVFCRETLGRMGQPYRRSRYYHLYLNGAYWGLYETDERPEASFGSTYLGGTKDDYDVVKCANHVGGFVTEVTDGNFGAWTNLFSMALSMLADSSASNYFRILGCDPDGTRNPALPVMIDVDNLIDYMLVIFYSGDGDATLSAFLSNTRPNNWFGMKNRNNPDQGFIFVNSDCEHTLGAPSWQNDRTGPWKDVSGSNVRNFTYSNPQYMHEELMLNPEYRLRFADHVRRHFFNGGVLMPEAGTNRFLAKAVQINKAMRAYEARWGDANTSGVKYSMTDWTNRINIIVTSWFPTRTATVLAQLKADSLYPALEAPSFNQHGGDIAEGFAVSMTHPNATGTIYYTLDGTDPRLVGGAVRSTATAYANPVPLVASTRVKARVLSGSTWSAVNEADFAMPGIVPLRITELMYHPAPVTPAEAAAGFSNADDFEFVELCNVGPIALNLAGIAFVDGITFTFPSGTLAPGERIVLVKNVAAFTLRYGATARIAGYYGGNLNNAGEHLRLQDPTGRTILDFSYSDEWWPITDGPGFSLVADNESAPSASWSRPEHWRRSSTLGGSPGSANPPLPALPVVVINEVLSRPAAGGKTSVELANLDDAPAEVGDWWLTDDFNTPHKFRLPTGTVLPAGGFAVFTEDDFGPGALGAGALNLSAAGTEIRLFSGNAAGELTGYYQGWDFGPADVGVSFGRHVISTGADHLVAQTDPTPNQTNAGPRVSPVVITEVMYRPPEVPGVDAGLYEYIELFNRSAEPLPLFDPLAPTNTWRVTGGVDYFMPAGLTLAAGEFLVLVNFDPATEPALLAGFRERYAVPAQVRVLGPCAGQLNNAGESVELRRPTLLLPGLPAWVLLDKVNYDDAAPWPEGADGYGAALHRADAAAYGNDPAHWTAAAPRAGQPFVPGPVPVLHVEPASQTVAELASATFTVSVEGEGPFTYVWRKNGVNVPDATNATLTLPSVQLADAGAYAVAVINASGAIAVANATLTVLPVPVIVTHPLSVLANAGATVTFTVTATGTGPLTCQWRRNGQDISGATSSSYTVVNAQWDVNDGYYSVVVTDANGSRESEPALLTVKSRPVITQQPEFNPANSNVLEGRTFSLTIS